jgi:TP901 family phage tail tape measure protein
VSDSPLNAKATVEVDFIANGLSQLLTGVGQLNEAQGFSNKANVQLEQGLAKVATQYQKNTGAIVETATATVKQTSAATATAVASNAAAKATSAHTTSLIATRYALYDVSNAFGIAGIALTGFAGIAYKTAIDYQTDFASVARTTQLTGVAAEQLKTSLLGLSQTLPASFADITGAASLAGQLGIANNQIADFTENVIKFSATTNVSVDASATAFGRLNALLPDVQGNYNGLGSSILKVGINSVATETQIINIASRIAGIGSSAGLTSDQVIGLSGAIASVGIQPYGASGTVTRLFTKIETAVSQGGAALEAFGRISGESGAQFQQSWSTDKTGAIETLLAGINAQGPGAIAAIQSLGLKSAQDLPNILKLSQNIDLVKSSLSDAKTGMQDGTQLTDSYGIIADTVSAKLKVFTNNLQALESAIGSSSTGLGGLLDVANGFLKWLTDVAKSPVASVFLGIGVAATGLIGISLLTAAGLFRVAASMAAVQTAQLAAGSSGSLLTEAFNIIRTTATGASAAVAAESAATSEAVASNAAFITTSAGVTTAIDAETFGMGRAAAGTAAFVVATDGATEALSAEAIAANTAAAASAGGAVGVAKLATGLKGLAGAAFGLPGLLLAISAAGASLENVGFTSITDGINNLFGRTSTISDFGKAIDDGPTAAIKRLQATLGDKGAGNLDNLFKNSGSFANDAQQNIANTPIIGTLTYGSGAAQSERAIGKADTALSTAAPDKLAASYAALQAAALKAGQSEATFKNEFPLATAAMETNTKAAKTSTDQQTAQTQAVTDALSASSDVLDATLKQENALYALGNSLGQTGNDFNSFSATGRVNLKDLEAVVSSITAQTAGDAQSTANNLQGLFNALTQGAKIPAAALTFLSDSIANLGVKSIVPTTIDLSSLNQGLGDGMTTAANKATKAANSAAKAVYTLVNYGNDLSGVFTRAFNIRYSGQEGLDTISKGWSAIAAAAQAAALAEQTAYAKLQQLTSDKAIDEYYLTVANAYGDTLRASQLQAELAQNAVDTASANKDLKTAQDATNTSLVGNSDAAIANRSTILGLVTNYQSYITALASSGLSQADLAKKTAALKADFIQQATQLGYNQTELGTYASAFDDVSTAIAKVPRKITVSADANPAMQALNEFLANAKTAIGSGINVPLNVSANTSAQNAQKIASDKSAWAAFYAARAAQIQTPAQFQQLKNLFVSLTGITDGFANGGYTGDGGKYQPAGIVHAGEFVFSKEATSRIGVNNLAYAHSQAQRGYADGGYVSAASAFGGTNGGMPIVQLSPVDRGLIMQVADAAASNKISRADLAGLASASNANNANRRAA